MNDINNCYLVVYDIESDKRRHKVSTVLESYGVRVQKSAFECYLNDRRLGELKKQLNKIANEEDSIRVYSLKGKYYDASSNSESETYRTELFIF